MTRRIVIGLCATLAGCTAGDRALFGCPEDEVCSDRTPNGLHFFGAPLAGELLDLGPPVIAVGGTQLITLQEPVGDDELATFTAAYAADDGGGPAIRVDATDGPVVTLRGDAEGKNLIRIVDPDDGALFDRKEFQAAPLTGLRIVPATIEDVGDDFVFAAGDLRVGVALLGGDLGSEFRLVDESMTLTLAGATRTAWDTVELADAPAGTYDLEVAAGGLPAAVVSFEVVDTIDELATDGPGGSLIAGQGGLICFTARSTGRDVAGLAWSFETDNGTHTELVANCAAVTPERAGTLTITATAGGLTRAETFPVGAAARRVAPAQLPPRAATAGDRAARLR